MKELTFDSFCDLYHGDCLEIVPTLAPASVDAIITDIPYGTTACKWDTIIPFDDLWRIVKHALKPRGVFITTSSQPFTSALVMSNLKWFKYEWIWNKVTSGGLLAKYRPIIQHENVLVFCMQSPNYYPIKEKRDKPIRQKLRSSSQSAPIKYNDGNWRYYDDINPKTILTFQNGNGGGKIHPTQKPVALYEYLIKTYTNECETVLDICMGSGTTGVACKNTGRNFIGIEKELNYFEIARERIGV